MSNDLITVESINPVTVFTAEGIDPLIEAIREKVADFTPDTSTSRSRADIASMAYKVARSKTALDELGKELVAGKKQEIAAVDAARRKMRTELDALRNAVRQPLTEWEEAERLRKEEEERRAAEEKRREEERVAAIKEKVAFFGRKIREALRAQTSDEVQRIIDGINAVPVNEEHFPMFLREAQDEKTAAHCSCVEMLASKRQEEEQAREAERIRQEREALEAERRAEEARQEAERRKIEEERQAMRAKQEEERRKLEAEREQMRLEQEAKKRAEQDMAEQRERERLAREAAEREEAERKRREAAERARQEAMRPDREKLAAWAQQAIDGAPDLQSDEMKQELNLRLAELKQLLVMEAA